MIALGLDNSAKSGLLIRIKKERGLKTIHVIGEPLPIEGIDHVTYKDCIEYKPFYRLLREIKPDSLVVVNECLRNKNRNDLTYNCIRHFLALARHQVVFQYFPFIDSIEQFMILLDFDTKSINKGFGFSSDFLSETTIQVQPRCPEFNIIKTESSPKTKARYRVQKKKLFEGIGNKDPHTLPRNLYLIGGKEKLSAIEDRSLVGRNNRFKIPQMQTYKEADDANRTVFELPHNFITLTDWLRKTGQGKVDVLSVDLKADEWYVSRLLSWKKKMNEAYNLLHQ